MSEETPILVTEKERKFLYDLVVNLPFQATLASLPKSEKLQELMALAAKLEVKDETS
jgi:hypothetical protein